MSHVPFWVYVIFFVLLYIGIRRCFTRTVSVERLLMLPIVFALLGIRGIINMNHFHPLYLLYWLAALAFGCLLSYVQIRHKKIEADHDKHLIKIPGDYTILIMLLGIFFIEFIIHYAVAAAWEIANCGWFEYGIIAVSGTVIGLSIGRNMTYLYKYTKAASVTLSKS